MAKMKKIMEDKFTREAMRIERQIFRGMMRPLILSILEHSELQGYHVLKQVEAIIRRRPNLSTIYIILSELEKNGLVKSRLTQNGGRIYTITEEGLRILSKFRSRAEKRLTRTLEVIMGKQIFRR